MNSDWWKGALTGAAFSSLLNARTGRQAEHEQAQTGKRAEEEEHSKRALETALRHRATAKPYDPSLTADDQYDIVVHLLKTRGNISIHDIQQELSIGYNRAANLMDRLLDDGFLTANPVSDAKVVAELKQRVASARKKRVLVLTAVLVVGIGVAGLGIFAPQLFWPGLFLVLVLVGFAGVVGVFVSGLGFVNFPLAITSCAVLFMAYWGASSILRRMDEGARPPVAASVDSRSLKKNGSDLPAGGVSKPQGKPLLSGTDSSK